MIADQQVTIIGGGPAGLSAAIYAARAKLNPIVLMGVATSSQLMTTTDVENYCGLIETTGPKMIEVMVEQAQRQGANIVYDEVSHVYKDGDWFVVQTSMFESFRSRAVIIATGSKPRTLDVPGSKELWNKGVSTCAVCDSRWAKDVDVVVVGGGDVACEEASYVSRLAKKVYVVLRRDAFRASKVMQDRLMKCSNVEVVYNSQVKSLEGEKNLETVTLEDTNGQTRKIDAHALFWCIGNIPQTDIIKDLVNTKDDGHILVYEGSRTSTPGIFAAGDSADWVYRQAIVAAGMGCMAALDAEKYLMDGE